MKKLYAYSDEREARNDEFVEKLESIKNMEEGLEYLGLDTNSTFGDVFASLLRIMLDIPDELWTKKLDDLDKNDIAFLDKLDSEVITFSRD